LADQENARQQTFGRFVSAARLATLIAGPVVGVLLGWRLAGMLHRSMARIAVTLREAGSSVDNDLGTIAIEASGNVEDVQRQAEQVAERMRQVSQQLQVARSEILRSERLAAVGELAAGVAHEIRNPLTSIKLLLQHAVRQATGPRLDEAKINLILDEIDRMELIIQGLLDFSRPPRLNRVRHDLRQTMQRALNLVEARAHQQKIEIVTDASDVPLTVDGDTEKLHQVLVNLLINAIEEMGTGGRLTIDAKRVTVTDRNEAHDSNGKPNQSEGNVIQVVIRDTGGGIPDNLLPRLFEPFATTKERGTGLGLAVSRRIVEEHAGRICACNRPDGGAEFKLEIPASDGAA
jgi:signal transduction histidine kinase